MRELSRRGHRVLFLERDVSWYAENRDLARPPYGRTELYTDLPDLKKRFSPEVREADVVIVGSYVPDGIAVGEWVQRTATGATAFYDIDTPVTLAGLSRGGVDYVSPSLIARYDLYLSFTGGPTLGLLERKYKARAARSLYCSVDPALYYPEPIAPRWELAYMGTYSQDRQPSLDRLLLQPAAQRSGGRFAVVGPLYPESLVFPANVERIAHLPPDDHRSFYNAQRFTLNITRADMIKAGYSPSVRLFEAAACGTPIISDNWPGLESFFKPGEEILLAASARDVTRHLSETSEAERLRIGQRARERVLASHTAEHRAQELEEHVLSVLLGRGGTKDRSA